MRSHQTHAYFPYRCSPCGIVSVNIAADELVCPRNKTHKLTRIAGHKSDRLRAELERGSRKKSLLEMLGLKVQGPAPIGRTVDPEVVCQWDDHELYDHTYLCPYCREEALTFSENGIKFD